MGSRRIEGGNSVFRIKAKHQHMRHARRSKSRPSKTRALQHSCRLLAGRRRLCIGAGSGRCPKEKLVTKNCFRPPITKSKASTGPCASNYKRTQTPIHHSPLQGAYITTFPESAGMFKGQNEAMGSCKLEPHLANDVKELSSVHLKQSMKRFLDTL